VSGEGVANVGTSKFQKSSNLLSPYEASGWINRSSYDLVPVARADRHSGISPVVVHREINHIVGFIALIMNLLALIVVVFRRSDAQIRLV